MWNRLAEIRRLSELPERASSGNCSGPLGSTGTGGACGLTILQQFIGINTIGLLRPTFLSKAGLGDSAAILNSVGLSVIGLITTLISLVLVDRVGRKPSW